MHCFFIPVLASLMTVALTMPFTDSIPSLADNNFFTTFVADALLNPIDTESSGSTTSNAYDNSANSFKPLIQSLVPSTGIGSASWGGDTQFGFESPLSTPSDSDSLENSFQLTRRLEFDWKNPHWKYSPSEYLPNESIWVCPLTPDQAKQEERRPDSTSVAFGCCPPDRVNEPCVGCKSSIR